MEGFLSMNGIYLNKFPIPGSGTIDFQEFLLMMSKQFLEKDTEEDLRETFEALDKDGNGFLSAFELRQILQTLGINLSDEEVFEMVAEADIDGDGKVNFEGGL